MPLKGQKTEKHILHNDFVFKMQLSDKAALSEMSMCEFVVVITPSGGETYCFFLKVS